MSKRRRYPQNNTPKPLPFELTITEVSRGGAGIGRDSNDRAVFVPFTAPGDVVKVQLTKIKQNYAEAELIELLKASPIRVTPPCPVFTQCGGCQWQHLPYELQWSTKFQGVLESLRRSKIVTPLHFDKYPAKNVWGYRNRIQLRGKGTQLGYYSSKSHQLVSIQRCDIAHPKINNEIQRLINDNARDSRPYKIELSLTPHGSVQHILNTQHAADGFGQVNDEQNINLQSWVKQSALQPNEPIDGILDLYGGSGNLSISLVEMVKEIHCVDLNIASSEISTQHRSIHFHNSAVLPWLERRLEKISNNKNARTTRQNWLALLDPPRNGLGLDGKQIIKLLEKLKVSSVILVGCKADPWARDLSHFIQHGWSLDKIAIFDFFPQTYHVESAAMLQRKA